MESCKGMVAYHTYVGTKLHIAVVIKHKFDGGIGHQQKHVVGHLSTNQCAPGEPRHSNRTRSTPLLIIA